MKRSYFHRRLNDFIGFLDLKNNEKKIFNTVADRKLTIKQLVKTTRLSEKTIRTAIKNLIDRQFIKKDLLLEGHVKYCYYSNSSQNIIESIKEKLKEMDE